jgi:hypothetical protein
MVSLTVGGPGFVAVGGDAGNAAVWTSVDAVTWKRVPDEGNVFGSGDQGMSSVTVGGPGLVAVGGDGADIAVWTSVDGVKWSRVVHDEAVFGDASVFSVIEGGPGLVAVGSTEPGDNRSRLFNVDAVVWTSVDGLTWSRVPHDETVFGGEENQIMNDVTVGGPGLVAVGYDGCCSWDNPLGVAAVWTSIDGVVWSRVPHDDSVFGSRNDAMVSVTAGGPGLVAVGYSFGCRPVWTSVDGITWSRVTDDVPGTCNRVIRDVIATEGGLVAVGHGAGSWTSVDGTNWIQIYGYVSDSQGRMLSVTETDSGLVAVGGVGLNTGSNGDGAVWLWNG